MRLERVADCVFARSADQSSICLPSPNARTHGNHSSLSAGRSFASSAAKNSRPDASFLRNASAARCCVDLSAPTPANRTDKVSITIPTDEAVGDWDLAAVGPAPQVQRSNGNRYCAGEQTRERLLRPPLNVGAEAQPLPSREEDQGQHADDEQRSHVGTGAAIHPLAGDQHGATNIQGGHKEGHAPRHPAWRQDVGRPSFEAGTNHFGGVETLLLVMPSNEFSGGLGVLADEQARRSVLVRSPRTCRG